MTHKTFHRIIAIIMVLNLLFYVWSAQLGLLQSDSEARAITAGIFAVCVVFAIYEANKEE